MRAALVMLLSTALCTATWAQQPTIPLSALDGVPAPSGPIRYATEDLQALRFLGEEVPGPTFRRGEALEVLYEEAGQVRVRGSDRYGWVPAAKLADEAPAPPTTESSGG